jgi:hypothetical protein
MRLAMLCPFCAAPTLLGGGGREKAVEVVRDHFKKKHANVPTERKRLVAERLPFRPRTELKLELARRGEPYDECYNTPDPTRWMFPPKPKRA